MARWLGLFLLLLAALACASQDAQLSSARPTAASLSDPEDEDAAADALAAAEAEAARLLHGALFMDEYEMDEELEEEVEDSDDNPENEEDDEMGGEDETEGEDSGAEGDEAELMAKDEEEPTADDARDAEEQTPSPRAAPARLTIRSVIFPDASVASTSTEKEAALGEDREQAEELTTGVAGDSGDDDDDESIEEEEVEDAQSDELASSESPATSDHEAPATASDASASEGDVETAAEDDDLAGHLLSGGSDTPEDDSSAASAGDADAAADDLDGSTCAADSASGANGCGRSPLLLGDTAESEVDELLVATSPAPADVSTALNSSSAFQDAVRDLAVAVEQIALALREGHTSGSLSSAIASARERVSASARSAMAFSAAALAACSEQLLLAQAKLMLLADACRERLGAWGDSLARALGDWSKQTRSAGRELAAWCWEVWATYEELRVLARNLRALALLALGGLLFSALYRAAAAIPELLLAYLLSLDDVTRAQLKIFSAALALLVVYHARVLAWFWLLALAALGYYYWSGHVVIRVEFK